MKNTKSIIVVLSVLTACTLIIWGFVIHQRNQAKEVIEKLKSNVQTNLEKQYEKTDAIIDTIPDSTIGKDYDGMLGRRFNGK